MRWHPEAEQAMARIPFFVRKRVRKKVEEETQRHGETMVTMAHVSACRQRFMKNQEQEVEGYQVETCFGPGGCPNRIDTGKDLVPETEALLAAQELKKFMRSRVRGPLKMHHEFRVSISDCPNGCSRPQIVDIGLLGACAPKRTEAPCSDCGACVAACREQGITLPNQEEGPTIEWARCLACGRCAQACPTGTISTGQTGYRILLGGKLGRHPQLGRELDGIFPPDRTLDIITLCLAHFKAENRHGERFGEVLNRTGFGFLAPYTMRPPL